MSSNVNVKIVEEFVSNFRAADEMQKKIELWSDFVKDQPIDNVVAVHKVIADELVSAINEGGLDGIISDEVAHDA